MVSYCVQTSFLLHFDIEYLTNKLVSTTLSNCKKLGLYLGCFYQLVASRVKNWFKLDRVARQEIIKDSSSDKLGPLEGALSDNYPSAGDKEFTKFISTYFCSFLWFLAKKLSFQMKNVE